MPHPGPLRDCRVLELGTMIAGPFAGRLLADFGAEVIKVEPPDGDPIRDYGDQFEGKSLYWASVSRNKRVCSINLKHSAGRDLVRRMMAKSDVVIENFRPGQMEKWGLGYDQIKAEMPRLVMVRVSGFGQTGPYRERPGFGIIGESLSGVRELTGHPDRPPARVATPLTDYLAAVYAAFGTMMALYERDRTGHGQCVDATLLESAFSMMEGFVPAFEKLGLVPSRVGTRLPGHAPNNTYPTKDGSHIHIAAGNNAICRRLAVAMGKPELGTDPRFAEAEARNANFAALDDEIAAWTKSVTKAEAYRALLENDVPAAPIYTIADIFADPHFKARDMLVRASDEDYGTVTVAGVAPKLSATPGEIQWAGRRQGADTRAILKDVLDLSEAEIEGLIAQGIAIAVATPKSKTGS